MSGECEVCGEHILDCKCSLTDKLRPFCRRQQNDRQPSIEHLTRNFEHLNPKIVPLEGMGGIDPPAEYIQRKTIDVNGRVEHEAIIKDAAKCKELGLDQVYEIIVYLNRWGSWLEIPQPK